MCYIGNGIYRERIYLDRQPKVGDRVEYIYRGYLAEFPIGSEGTIVNVQTGIPYVLKVGMDRSDDSVSYIHEEWIAIFEDRYYKSTGEKRVKRRFLGIPFGSRTIQTYEEVTEC